MKVEYAAFPVAVAIRNVEGLVKVLLQKKNLVLETEIPEELPVLIADQAKFKQILYNLTSNAIKFTPEGGRITIAASAVNDGKMLEVSVTDTGIGIKQEDQDRIFREFEQVDNSYARMQQGTGLGLALVKRFVEVHGGRVRVYSGGEGKGTTFTFMMPFTPPDEDEVEAEVFEVASVATPELGKPIILVVDDDQSASELLTHHLQGAGYAVSRAFSATDALVLAREMQPHVITLDVQLPDKEGWEVLAELKRDPVTRNIPVLMVSILEDRDRALQLGAADCFVKPVVKDRLLGAIAREVTANSQRRNIVGTPVMAESVVAVASNGTANGNGTHEESDTVEEASEESAESTPTRGRRGSRTRTAG
jgi:DNA-binding response OmpR family regulator/anti-sigma regulatory factor (Ser/Thr protein kinase)